MKKNIFKIGFLFVALTAFAACSDSDDCECTITDVEAVESTIVNDEGEEEFVTNYVEGEKRNFLFTDYEGDCKDISAEDVPGKWKEILSEGCKISCSDK